MPYESTLYDCGPGGTVTVLSWVPDPQPQPYDFSATIASVETALSTVPGVGSSQGYTQDLHERDAWIAWYQQELARRDQTIAGLREQVRTLTDAVWELQDAPRSEFEPLLIAGREDVTDIRGSQTVAFKEC